MLSEPIYLDYFQGKETNIVKKYTWTGEETTQVWSEPEKIPRTGGPPPRHFATSGFGMFLHKKWKIGCKQSMAFLSI